MAIPRSERPEYKATLPISKKRVAYSSFNMRTERTLMLATMSGDTDEITQAVINCINDHLKSDLKAEDLPQAEAELLLILMRSKSVGETIQVKVYDPETESDHELSIDLRNIKVNVDEDFTNIITLKNGNIIKFRLPSLSTLDGVNVEGQNDFDTSIELLKRCIESIAIDDEVFTTTDNTPQELEDFLMDLDSGDFIKITENFLAHIPTVSYTEEIKREDGSVFRAEVSGLQGFL